LALFYFPILVDRESFRFKSFHFEKKLSQGFAVRFSRVSLEVSFAPILGEAHLRCTMTAKRRGGVVSIGKGHSRLFL